MLAEGAITLDGERCLSPPSGWTDENSSLDIGNALTSIIMANFRGSK